MFSPPACGPPELIVPYREQRVIVRRREDLAGARAAGRRCAQRPPVARPTRPRPTARFLRHVGDVACRHAARDILRTGMQWREVESSVHYTTLLRRMHLWSSNEVFTAAYRRALKIYKRLFPTKHYCVDSSYIKNAFGRECVGKNHTDQGSMCFRFGRVSHPPCHLPWTHFLPHLSRALP